MSSEELLSDIKSAKKASRRGKMSQVTKIVNSLNNLIANNASRREIQGMKISLSEALSGFKNRHDEYIAILTDEEEIDIATEKLFGKIPRKIYKRQKETILLVFDDLQAHVQVLEGMGPDVSKYLDDPRRMKAVVAKLPASLKIAWALYKDEKQSMLI